MSEAATYLREIALKYLAVRPRSEQELVRHLGKRAQAKGITEPVIESVVSRMKFAGLIDDTVFAEWLITARRGKAARGNALIRHELHQKGISEEIIESLFSDKDAVGDEYDRAVKFLSGSRKKWAAKTGKTRLLKLRSMLSYRGFSYQVIARLIDEYAEKDYNNA